jgi:ABC-type nitrate/sulfonate/bicarbonate transport system substrate-binding protein
MLMRLGGDLFRYFARKADSHRDRNATTTKLRCQLVAFLFATIVALPAQAAVEKVRIGVPTITANSAFFIVALNKGYFAEEGLEVEVVGAGGGVSTPALISGDLQFSLSTGSAISAIVKGARLTVVMVTQDRPGGEIWSAKPEIKSLDDLRGKQVGIQTRGDTGEIALRSLLDERNLPNDFLSFTPVGTGGARLATLKAGALPAVLLYWTDIEDLRLSGGLGSAHSVVDLGNLVRMVYNGLVTSDRLIKNRPDLVEKVVRASLKGVAYIRAFHDQSIKIIAEYGNAPLEGTTFEFDKVIQSARPNNLVDADFQMRELALRAALLGVQKSEIPANANAFDFAFVERQADALKDQNWKPEP